MTTLKIQPISRQVCFVVERASSALVWYGAGQSWWPITAAEQFVLKSNCEDGSVNLRSEEKRG